MFRPFSGRRAELLTYYKSPHSTAIVGVRGPTRAEDEFIFLYGCRRLQAPVNWTVGELTAARREVDFVTLRDAAAQVLVDFNAGRLFSRNDALAFVRGDAVLTQMLEDFHSGDVASSGDEEAPPT
ncbi:MAG: hypothetical protein RIC55_08875 [Pirellulaceae bacterium]